MTEVARIALTPGEPAGIGPDLAVIAAQQSRNHELVAIADAQLLATRAQQLGLPLTLRDYQPSSKAQTDPAGTLSVLHTPLGEASSCGQLSVKNADYVLTCLQRAVDGCVQQSFDAMVTGPVHKGVINDAGIAFSGHTEFIAERTNADPVMMLAAGSFRVALATTHLPLHAVPAALTSNTLEKVCRTLDHDLRRWFGIASPEILVCGLNPHAGEGGHLGDEEITVISPVLERLNAEGMNFIGPLPADTLFTPRHLDSADAALAMFHDQGLPVLKYAGFGSAINITLGLPIIRTSVDHGTALDLAGSGNIDSGSIQAAIDLALQLGGQRQSEYRN